jgi:hypothetical protein
MSSLTTSSDLAASAATSVESPLAVPLYQVATYQVVVSTGAPLPSGIVTQISPVVGVVSISTQGLGFEPSTGGPYVATVKLYGTVKGTGTVTISTVASAGSAPINPQQIFVAVS